MIRIDAVSKAYGAIDALRAVSLEIAPGVFGLVGPNGAGKTTLLRIIATLVPPSSGAVSAFGIDILRDPLAVRAMLGYLPQEYGAYPQLSGREYLEYIALLKRIPRPARQIQELLDRFNLDDVAHRRVRTYSGGMLRRIGIAQALLGDPRLLLVDEPTGGLDPEERARFRDFLMDLGAGRVVVLSTHLVEDIAATCDHLSILHRGTLRYLGTPSQLLQAYEGRIYEISVDEASAKERLEEWGPRVLTTQRAPQGRLIRLLDEVVDGRPVSASLEDAYLACVRS